MELLRKSYKGNEVKFFLKLAINLVLTFAAVNYLGFGDGTLSKFLAIIGFTFVIDIITTYAFSNNKIIHVTFDPKYKEETDRIIEELKKLQEKE